MINDKILPNPNILKNFHYKLSRMMGYEHYASDVNEISKSIIQRYFPTGEVDQSYSKLVEMFTDGDYIHCMLDTAIKFSPPVYYYVYDYQNEFSFNILYGNLHQKLGVTHGDELISLFKLRNWNNKELNEKDLEISKLMVDIWTRFATSDVPTIDGTESSSVWPIFDTKNQSMLYINSNRSSVIQNPFEEKYKFWNSLSLLSKLTEYFSKSVTSTTNTKNEL
uniref:Esterase FE4 n=1 Tax=Sipha flava TaxID=143950 RepID=A0A2S2QV73_9HEMI